MKMSKLFVTVFEEEMRSRGFRRKGKLYYRLHGEMLQGVILKAINPYDICFSSFPLYWNPQMKIIEDYLNRGFYPKNEIVKGYWAEDANWGITVNCYYREENEQENANYMQVCLEIAKQHILPRMEEITDIDALLKANHEIIAYNKEKPSISEKMTHPSLQEYMFPFVNLLRFGVFAWDYEYLLLQKAHNDGDFAPAHQFAVETLEHYKRMNDRYPSLFLEKMEANDLNWIEELRQKRKAWLLPKLRDELGIVVT